MIKLYEHPFSPYVQKVKISLFEKNIPFETEIPNAFSGGPTDFGQSNPRLEVPALIDDGFAIFDSTVILEYLEDKWPKPPMLPAAPRDRARVRMIEDLCDTYYEAINWGLMEAQAWKRVTGDIAAAITKRAEAADYRHLPAPRTRARQQRVLQRRGTFGWGDLERLPVCVKRKIPSGGMGLSGRRVGQQARQMASALVNQRESIKKTLAATADFAGNLDALPHMLATRHFKRQYRDHRLEWMVRSGGKASRW